MRLGILVAIAAISCVAGSASAAEELLPLERAALDAAADGATHSLVALAAPLDVRLDAASAGLAAPAAPSAAVARELRAAALLDGPIPLLPDDALYFLFDGTFGPYAVKVPAAAPPAPQRLTPRAPSVRAPLGGAFAPALAHDDAAPVDEDAAAPPVATFHSTRARTASAPTAAPPAPRVPPTAQAAVAAAAGAALLALLGVALYHRIRPNSALENDTRKTIFDAVCSQPGLGVHAIAERAGVSYSTATYHLERLQAAGMIVMTPDGNKLCYYKNGGAFTETERRILPLLKNDEAIRLFEAILHAPGTYRAALAEHLGVTATTVNWHLKRLREAGLVQETRHGRNAYLYADTQALQVAMNGLSTKIPTTDEIVIDRLRRYAAMGASGTSDASASS